MVNNERDIVDFNYHARKVFDNWKSTVLTKATKFTLKGEVVLADGTTHVLIVRKHSDTFYTYSHKEVK